MSFSYFDNADKLNKINDIKAGDKWAEIKTDNDMLNSIFKQVDDGDGIVQQDELDVLNRVLTNVDKLSAEDKVISNEELETLNKNLEERKVTQAQLKLSEKFNPEDYSFENVKKCYPSDKFDIEVKECISYKIITVTDKSDGKVVFRSTDHYRTNNQSYTDILLLNKGEAAKSICIDKNITVMDYVAGYRGSDIIFQQQYDKEGNLLSYTDYTSGRGKVHYVALDKIENSIKNKDLSEMTMAFNMIDSENIKTVFAQFLSNNSISVEDAIKQADYIDDSKKAELLSGLQKILEKNVGYKENYSKQNSQIKNKYYEGGSYNVVQNGDILEVTNNSTNVTHGIDFTKLFKNVPMEQVSLMKATLQKLPGEVLEDFAIECDSLKYNNNTQAGGYFTPVVDDITMKMTDRLTLTHELGHAMDYRQGPFGDVSAKSEFYEIYKRGMEKYLSDGKIPFSKSGTNYATQNAQELFAECYAFLMLGKAASTSSDAMVTYFSEALDYIKLQLVNIRALDDSQRHRKTH